MFLGRSQEFLTLFGKSTSFPFSLSKGIYSYSSVLPVTDDVSVKEKGLTTLAFVATVYKGLDRWKSRRGVKCRLVTGESGTAGVRLDKQGLRIEDEENFTVYKTLEMSFEDEKGITI